MAEENLKSQTSNLKFFELVNWKKAQPKMKKGGAQWMKLYTNLLYHEGFLILPSTQQMNIIALWLYAAVSGHHILPADPKWLLQRIPLLKEPLDLEMLANAVDAFGNHNPFIRFCEAPKPKKVRSKKTEREREREKESREKNPSGSRKKDREKKDESKAGTQNTEQQKTAETPVEHPKESEAGSAKAAHKLPKPARSAFNGPEAIGSIIKGRFPDHWTDPDAEAFGYEIIDALGINRDPDEWGAFAKFWTKVKARASPILLGEIRAKAIEKARFVNSPKAKAALNKSAVWFSIMYGELSSMGIQIEKAKSG